MSSPNAITVERYQPKDASQWRAFLSDSDNGTLFHDLDFLSYHPADRFETHHLVFRQNSELIARLPAATVKESDGRRFFKSPYGGSVGGFVLPVGQKAETTLRLVACLQDYVSALGLAGIEMRIGPSIYAEHPNDTLSFAVAASGFSLAARWLIHVLVLPQDPRELFDRLPSERRATYVRAALRQGAAVTRAGVTHLPRFYEILAASRARHSARPTHTLSELERIFKLTPNRVQLYLCNLGEEIIGGTLIFELHDRIAYSFYPCHDERFSRYRPDMVVLFGVAEQYAARGFRYLDLGPTTFDDFRLNPGLARFKEEMGGLGFCRDNWRWEARLPVPSRSAH